jgi:hypothetical protein
MPVSRPRCAVLRVLSELATSQPSVHTTWPVGEAGVTRLVVGHSLPEALWLSWQLLWLEQSLRLEEGGVKGAAALASTVGYRPAQLS